MRPILIYCYDAYCGWCYGFSHVIKQIASEYADHFQLEVLSGGMILPSEPMPVSVMAGYIKEAYPVVEQRTGIRFGRDYLWHIENPDQSDWFPSSELPAIALCVFKSFLPDKQVELASDIQYGLFEEGRDLADPEAYRHLIVKYALDESLFYQRLKDVVFKERAYEEFDLCQKLQVKGYPQLLCQLEENKFHLVSNGYTGIEEIRGRLDHLLLTKGS